MNNEFVKFKKLETEYLRLLEIASHGENRRNLKDVPLEKLGEHILDLEKEIVKLKEELSSDGIDVNSYLEKDNSLD